MQGLWDGAYGLSSLSDKTRKSNRLQMSLKRQHFLLSYPECWSGRDLNQRPPARQTGAYPTELTGRRLSTVCLLTIPGPGCSKLVNPRLVRNLNSHMGVGERGQGGGSPGKQGAGGVRETGEERAGSGISTMAGSGRKKKRQAFVICYCLHPVKETNPTTCHDFHLTFSEA